MDKKWLEQYIKYVIGEITIEEMKKEIKEIREQGLEPVVILMSEKSKDCFKTYILRYYESEPDSYENMVYYGLNIRVLDEIEGYYVKVLAKNELIRELEVRWKNER